MNPTIDLLRGLLLAVAIGLTGLVQAASTRPDELVKTTTEEVLVVISQTRDRQQLLQAAETKVLPHFDFKRMTQLAVGRAWAQATPEQKQTLENEFRNLLVRTYTNALIASKQKKASVEMRPLRVEPDSKEVVVRSRVLVPGGQPIAIDYQMANSPAGWKVFDVVVENISLVTNYRESFAAEIKNSGIDGLIRVLAEKNRALAGKS